MKLFTLFETRRRYNPRLVANGLFATSTDATRQTRPAPAGLSDVTAPNSRCQHPELNGSPFTINGRAPDRTPPPMRPASDLRTSTVEKVRVDRQRDGGVCVTHLPRYEHDVGALGDQERCECVSEVVEPHLVSAFARDARLRECRAKPAACRLPFGWRAAEVAPVERSACTGCEDGVMGRGVA